MIWQQTPVGYAVQVAILGQPFLWMKLYDADVRVVEWAKYVFYVFAVGSIRLVWLINAEVGYYATHLINQYIVLTLVAVYLYSQRYGFKQALCLGFLTVFLNSYYWEIVLHVVEYLTVGYYHPAQFVQLWRLAPAIWFYKHFKFTNLDKITLLTGPLFSLGVFAYRNVPGRHPLNPYLLPLNRLACLLVLVYVIASVHPKAISLVSQRKKQAKKKLIIQVEVTTRCNHDCIYCPRYLIPENRPLTDITPEMADLLIQRVSGLGEQYDLIISVSGFGEPTLYPGLMDFVCKVKSVSNASMRLNTNASLLHEIGTQIISSNCVDALTLSLNLPTEELFQKYTQTKDFTKVTGNITQFLHEKQDQKPATNLRFIKTPDAAPYLGEATRHWEKHLNNNDRVSIAELSNWGGLIGETSKPRTGPCRYLKNQAGKHLSITLDGYASICCFSIALKPDHPLVVGNIKDHSIEELLSLAKRRAREIRVSSVCKNCNTPEYRSPQVFLSPLTHIQNKLRRMVG